MKRSQKSQEMLVKKEKFQRGNEFPQLLPKNENQKLFLEALKYDTVVVGEGSSGVGKTLLACWYEQIKREIKEVKGN